MSLTKQRHTIYKKKNMKNNIHSKDITPKQQEIIRFLSVYTLLTSTQTQALLQHKNHKRSATWLKDLTKKGYLQELPFKRNTAKIFCLQNKRVASKNISLLTIDRYLLIVDIFLHLQKDAGANVKFFTQITMPQEIEIITPDAYFIYKSKRKEKTYFLELDRETQSLSVMKKKFEKYSKYYYAKHWKQFTPVYFPAVCVVSVTKERKEKLVELVEELFNTSKFAPIVFKFTTIDEFLTQGSHAEICLVPFEKEMYGVL